MQHWYVVQVIPSHEKKVKKNIEEALASKGMAELIIGDSDSDGTCR